LFSIFIPDALHGLVRKINLKTYEPVETFGSIPRENALSLQYSHTITSTDCGCATFVAELVPPRVRLFTTQDGLKEGVALSTSFPLNTYQPDFSSQGMDRERT